MTPGARIAAAAQCLDQILAGQAAERVLTNWARASRYAGSKDRAAVRDHVYEALRCRNSYAALGGAQTGRALMIGALRAAGTPPEQLFTGEGHAPAPLTPHEAAHRGERVPDLPDWIMGKLADQHGPDRAAQIDALYRQRAPIGLRVARGMSSQDAARALALSGIETRATAVPGALIALEGARKLHQHPLYLSGQVELQDLGAQEMCLAIAPAFGARVLDYCAGGGGKILALADQTKISAFAHDSDGARMADLPARADRAGVHIQVIPPGQVSGQFDLVLVDAPCSGSGTWRRAPDVKWRFGPDDLTALIQVQAQILRDAAKHVAPGGRLVYGTCSVFSEENQEQVAQFCAQSGFDGPHHLRLPDEDADGFFWAILTRD